MSPVKWKLYGECRMCRKKRFFVRIRSLIIPTGERIRGRVLLCNGCHANLNRVINRNGPQSKLEP